MAGPQLNKSLWLHNQPGLLWATATTPEHNKRK